jgi:molecular chaperone GrpE
MHKALEAEGLAVFGMIGEAFDPTRHECMSVLATSDAEVDNTIAQVLQNGYMVGTEVVRPAKVVVYQSE